MTTLMLFLRNTQLLMCIFLTTSCSATNAKTEIALVGSTPGNEPIKSMLSISTDAKVDFIRWNLILDKKNSFVLDIDHGESQPNTLGFKGNGEKKTFKGTFSISQNYKFKEVYHLKSADFSTEILIAKLNENIFHLLTSQNQLMVGNGGWSYSLSRKKPVHNNEILIASAFATEGKSLQVIYDGRTPCQEIAYEHPEINANQSCFKLKWRLILNKDSITHQPTTCTIRNIINNQPREISGKWEIIKGTGKNPDALIYKIKADNLTEPILLFVGDENILFFLDQNNKSMIGNKDFSFTLNKISQ